MKVRTTEQLLDAVSSDSAKRKQELVTIESLIRCARGHEKRMLNRAAVVLSYAHWEGFVKRTADYYVQHIAATSPSVAKLKAPFQSIFCKNAILHASTATKKISPHLKVIELLVDNIASEKFTNQGDVIDTEDNLTWNVFLNILITIDISTSFWEVYQGWINDLVTQRCGIAHGEWFEIEEKYAIEVIKNAIYLIDIFSADVTNAAQQKAYFRS